MKIIKTIISFVTIIMLCINMVSCSLKDKITYNSQEKLEEYGENVYNAFVAHDTETLKSLFCEELQNNYDLDSDIEAAYEFLEDDIQGYDEMECHTGGQSIENGKTVYLDGFVKFCQTKTLDNNFTITINVLLIYKNNSTHIGIQNITIRDSNNNRQTIGKFLKSWH